MINFRRSYLEWREENYPNSIIVPPEDVFKAGVEMGVRMCVEKLKGNEIVEDMHGGTMMFNIAAQWLQEKLLN